MDRDELQERIRARRSGAEPYRRGEIADDEAGYQRFEPEPDDARIQRGRRADAQRPDHLGEPAPAGGAPSSRTERPDLTRDRDEWTAPVAPAVASAPGRADAVGEPDLAAADPPETLDVYDDDFGDAYQDQPYAYDRWDEPEPRSSGAGAFAILGFLALGVLALLGGAVVAGLFGDDDPGVGSASATPGIIASAAPEVSAEPSLQPSVAASAPASQAPASGEPVVFPDGFTAEAEPCLPGSASGAGCSSNGANNSGTVDIWVGFKNGTAEDIIGATIIGPDGATVAEGSIDLARINCGETCNGWTYFNFRNLTAGTYEVRVTRNGDPASQTSFEVS